MNAMGVTGNSLLLGASGYAMYTVKLDYPYAFGACAVFGCHALCGIAYSVQEGEGGDQKIQDIVKKIANILPLPLINTELLLQSSSSILALGHGLCIVPLTIVAAQKAIDGGGGEEGDENTSTLELMTYMGNVMALNYLAINEENSIYGAMVGTALIFYFAPELTEDAEVKKLLISLGESILSGLTSLAVEAFGKGS